MPEELVAIVIVFIVIGLPVLSFTLIKLARIMKGEDSQSRQERRQSGLSASDEARLMQDIHRGLTRMEQRIEALETIIIEKDASRQTRPVND